MSTDHPNLVASRRLLLDQALDLSPTDRATWLLRLRAEAPELAAKVESLLGKESSYT